MRKRGDSAFRRATGRVDGLGTTLYEELERLDPSDGPFVPFEALSEFERDLYEAAAESILARIKSRSKTLPQTI